MVEQQNGGSVLACEFCGGPVPNGRRRKSKRFCRDRCRAAWHAQKRQDAIAAVIAKLDDVDDDLDRLKACMRGVRLSLRATLHGAARTRRSDKMNGGQSGDR